MLKYMPRRSKWDVIDGLLRDREFYQFELNLYLKDPGSMPAEHAENVKQNLAYANLRLREMGYCD